jgi:predicted nuclease of restriction endonuclease-like (RecB) superfamily
MCFCGELVGCDAGKRLIKTHFIRRKLEISWSEEKIQKTVTVTMTRTKSVRMTPDSYQFQFLSYVPTMLPEPGIQSQNQEFVARSNDLD